MKVILLERVEKLGKVGEVVTVKNGYGRNYLVPRNKALRATPKNLEIFESKRQEYELKNKAKVEKASTDISRMKDLKLKIITQAQSSGTLYGSIMSRDIEAKLKEKSFDIPKSKILIPHPIREVGIHKVQIRLHPEVSCEIQVYVAGSSEALAKMLSPQKEEGVEEKTKKVVAAEETVEQEEATAEAQEEPKAKAKKPTKKAPKTEEA